MTALASLPSRLVLYDGVCGLCGALVRFMIRIDRDRKLRYAPLQGETAAALREEHPELPADIDTIWFFEDGKVTVRSRGVFNVMRHLGFPWRQLSVFRFLPQPLTDLGYRLVAAVRYRVFGKYDACRIPSPEERALFLP